MRPGATTRPSGVDNLRVVAEQGGRGHDVLSGFLHILTWITLEERESLNAL
jgi:hypothetical protein